MKLPPDMQRLDHIFDYCEEIHGDPDDSVLDR